MLTGRELELEALVVDIKGVPNAVIVHGLRRGTSMSNVGKPPWFTATVSNMVPNGNCW